MIHGTRKLRPLLRACWRRWDESIDVMSYASYQSSKGVCLILTIIWKKYGKYILLEIIIYYLYIYRKYLSWYLQLQIRNRTLTMNNDCMQHPRSDKQCWFWFRTLEISNLLGGIIRIKIGQGVINVVRVVFLDAKHLYW